jgi:hypothetical protein
MPRNEGCDIGPLIVGACAGGGSGAGIRFGFDRTAPGGTLMLRLGGDDARKLATRLYAAVRQMRGEPVGELVGYFAPRTDSANTRSTLASISTSPRLSSGTPSRSTASSISSCALTSGSGLAIWRMRSLSDTKRSTKNPQGHFQIVAHFRNATCGSLGGGSSLPLFLSGQHTEFRGLALAPADDLGLLAAKICGRRRNGVPLALSPETDSPPGGIPLEQLNNYEYVNADGSGDPKGLRCPVGAHMLRINPRGQPGTGQGQPGGSNNTHRLIRRGMPYGPNYDPKQPYDGIERGLLGYFINSSIENQYEFVLGQWVNDSVFAGAVRLHPKSKDHMIGTQDPAESIFVIPQANGAPAIKITGFSSFVTTRVEPIRRVSAPAPNSKYLTLPSDATRGWPHRPRRPALFFGRGRLGRPEGRDKMRLHLSTRKNCSDNRGHLKGLEQRTLGRIRCYLYAAWSLGRHSCLF